MYGKIDNIEWSVFMCVVEIRFYCRKIGIYDWVVRSKC